MSFVSCFPLIRCWTGCIPDIHRLLWESTVCRCSSIFFLPHTMGYTCKDKMSPQTSPCIYSTATHRWGESQWRRWWVWCQGIWTRWQSRNLFVNKIIILILTMLKMMPVTITTQGLLWGAFQACWGRRAGSSWGDTVLWRRLGWISWSWWRWS